MIHTRIGAALLLSLGLAARAQETPREPLLRPDPAQQAGIRRLLEAASAEEQRGALEALRASAGPEHGLLVAQLFWFTQQARDTRAAMLLGFVIAELAIPPAHVIQALVPLLESDDPLLRAALGNVLSEYEHRSLDRGADFGAYRALLERGVSLGLARHLFATDPGAALLALARVEVGEPSELRALLLAEHEVSDARWRLAFGFLAPEELARAAPRALEQLAFLSTHPRWWARLYAAESARQEPALRGVLRLEELARDAHPLVREAAATARVEQR